MSFLQLLLSAIGAYFLFRTLKANEITATEAGRASDAALRSVENAQADKRSRLVLHEINPEPTVGEVTFRAAVVNVGKGKGFVRRIKFYGCSLADGEALPINHPDNDHEDHQSRNDEIVPGAVWWPQILTWEFSPKGLYPASTRQFYIVGVVWYEDHVGMQYLKVGRRWDPLRQRFMPIDDPYYETHYGA